MEAGGQFQSRREAAGEAAPAAQANQELSLEELLGPIMQRPREIEFPRDFPEAEAAQIKESARAADRRNYGRAVPKGDLGELNNHERAIERYLKFAGRCEATIEEVLLNRRQREGLKSEWNAELSKMGIGPDLSLKEAKRAIKRAKKAKELVPYARNEAELAQQVDEFLETIDDRLKALIKDGAQRLKDGRPFSGIENLLDTNIAVPLEGRAFEFGRRKWSELTCVKLVPFFGGPYAVYRLCKGKLPRLREQDPSSIKSPSMAKALSKVESLGLRPHYHELFARDGTVYARLSLNIEEFIKKL